MTFDLGTYSMARLWGCSTYHGKLCEEHWCFERCASSGWCVECHADKKRESNRRRDPEKLRAYARKYNAENREARREYGRRYQAAAEVRERKRERDRRIYWADPDKRRENARRWAANNPGKVAEQGTKRRKLQSIPPWLTDEDRAAMDVMYDMAQALGLTVDHILPLKPCKCGRFGFHEPENLQLLTKAENSSKHNRCMPCWLKSGRPLARKFLEAVP